MNIRTRQRGTSFLELAVAAPILVAVTFGAVDLGRAVRSEIVSSSAARAGLQYAVQDAANVINTTQIEAIAKADAANPTGMVVNTSFFCTCSQGGAAVSCTTTCSGLMKYVKVESQIPFQRIMNLPYLPSNMMVTSTAKARFE